jgi:hypothetical protein
MSHSSLNLGQDLPSEIQFAIRMICELTGEDPIKIAQLHKDEIYSILSFLLKCEKDKIKKIFREHDENKELDLTALQMLWKLLDKGVVKSKHLGLLPLEKSVSESINLNFALMAREIMIDPNKKLGPAIATLTSTNAAVTNQTQNPTISLANLQKLANQYSQSTNQIGMSTHF